MLYKLRFFQFVPKNKAGDLTHYVDLKSPEIPKKGHLVYLGDVFDGTTIFRVERVVRSYSFDERDIANNNGSGLCSVEVYLVKTDIDP